jgi:hypothetical protein
MNLIMGKEPTLPLVQSCAQSSLGLGHRDPRHGLYHLNARTETGAMPCIIDRRLYHDRIPRCSDSQMAQLLVREGLEQSEQNDDG